MSQDTHKNQRQIRRMQRILKRLQDRTKAPRRWWRPLPIEEEIGDPSLCAEKWKREHDEISSSIRNTYITIVVYSLFCLLTIASAKDVDLLVMNATVQIPFANTDISFLGFVVVGPLILIGLTAYLHIFLGEWYRLRSLSPEGVKPLPFIFNLPTTAARWLSSFIFYWLPPIVLIIFTRFALAQPVGHILVWITALTIACLLWLGIRRYPNINEMSWKNMISYVIRWLLLLLAVVFPIIDNLPGIIDLKRNMSLIEANLEGADLRKLHLQGANLHKANLMNANLQSANLQKTNLYLANLEGANLGYANLQDANLIGANLKKANLKNVSLRSAGLYQAILIEANLQGAELGDANLNEANLQRANLTRASLWPAKLREANLEGANLMRANLRGANLWKANLKEADLHGANLEVAELDGADLRQAKNINCDQLKRARNWDKAMRDERLACGKSIPMIDTGVELKGAPLSQ